MPRFRHGPVELAFIDEGKGEPIVLVHGFASNKEVNWVYPRWVSQLTRAGRRAIAFDNRGHGESTKLYDSADYRSDTMAADVVALIDHLGLDRADLMGYSMGARICAFCAVAHPARVRSVVLGGIGASLTREGRSRDDIVAAMEADDPSAITDKTARAFRLFAEQTKSDRRALAACLRGYQQALVPEKLAQLRMPVMVAVGTRDEMAGPAAELAALIPGARALDIAGRDHMLAVGDETFMAAVVKFLAERP